MAQALLYLHGKGGSAAEGETFQTWCPGWTVVGITYTVDRPGLAVEEIRDAWDGLGRKYDRVGILANSIGAWLAMLALGDRPVDRGLFISPVLDMEELIGRMMTWAGVTEEDLRQRGEIPTDFGETLSWAYLTFVRANPVRWAVPTAILYGGRDDLTTRQTAETFAAAHNAALTVMEDGEHWFHTPAQMAFLGRWLEESLSR